jgi:hypothetical protein
VKEGRKKGRYVVDWRKETYFTTILTRVPGRGREGRGEERKDEADEKFPTYIAGNARETLSAAHTHITGIGSIGKE